MGCTGSSASTNKISVIKKKLDKSTQTDSLPMNQRLKSSKAGSVDSKQSLPKNEDSPEKRLNLNKEKEIKSKVKQRTKLPLISKKVSITKKLMTPSKLEKAKSLENQEIIRSQIFIQKKSLFGQSKKVKKLESSSLNMVAEERNNEMREGLKMLVQSLDSESDEENNKTAVRNIFDEDMYNSYQKLNKRMTTNSNLNKNSKKNVSPFLSPLNFGKLSRADLQKLDLVPGTCMTTTNFQARKLRKFGFDQIQRKKMAFGDYLKNGKNGEPGDEEKSKSNWKGRTNNLRTTQGYMSCRNREVMRARSKTIKLRENLKKSVEVRTGARFFARSRDLKMKKTIKKGKEYEQEKSKGNSKHPALFIPIVE